MKNRELFHKTFEAVPVPEALAERAARAARTERPVPRRTLRILAFAAAIIAALSACAVAVQKITSKPDLVTQCNLEMDMLRELGLFTAEFEVTPADEVPDFENKSYGPAPELSEDRYEGVITLRHGYGTGGEYSCSMDVDTDTGKITGLHITAYQQDNWVPVSTFFRNVAGSDVLGIYDNPEALFDTGMTLGGMCAAWAEYQGYERYELPEGAGADVPCLDARSLAAWDDGAEGELGEGLTVSFFREGGSEAEYACVNYGPSLMGPCVIIGRGGEVPIWRPSQALG